MPGVKTAAGSLCCLAMMSRGDLALAQIWPNVVPSFREIAGNGISEAQAEYIAALTAQHEGYRVWDDRSRIDRLTKEGRGETDAFPGFFTFSIGFDMPGYALIYFPREYYVSKMTGDVWQATTPSPPRCYRVSFAALRKIQKEIMAHTGSNFAAEKSQRAGIYCAGE